MPARTFSSVRISREVSDDSAQLREVAAGILRRPEVRAVVFDRRHLQATIVPQRRHVESTPAGEIEVDEIIEWRDPPGELVFCVRAKRLATGWRRVALLALTAGALVLALLGVLLPGLPTTPFVLVASYGLMRTSRKWHRRLLDSRLFGGVLRDWHLHRGISPHVRVKALALLAIVVGVTCFWPGTPPWVIGVVIVGALLGGTYVWRLPTAAQ